MSPRVLVLGAGGFLGRSLVDHVANRGGADLVLHYRDDKERSAFDGGRLQSHTLDLLTCPAGAIGAMVARVSPDVVVNCVGLIVGEPAELRAANVDVVVRLIDELGGRDGVHLVHLGSAAEYGTQRQRLPVSEKAVAAPENLYGVTKLEATERLMRAADEERISVTVLRLFNPVGRLSPASTLPGRAARRIHEAMRTGAAAINLGPLDSWRDYVDDRDFARAVLAATVGPRRPGVVLNVGRGEAVECLHLVKTLAAIAGFDGDIVESDRRSDRSASVDWQCADVGAIKLVLGWSAEYTIDDSLSDLWSGISSRKDFADA